MKRSSRNIIMAMLIFSIFCIQFIFVACVNAKNDSLSFWNQKLNLKQNKLT